MRYHGSKFDFIRIQFGNDTFKILKLWMDINYKLKAELLCSLLFTIYLFTLYFYLCLARL